MREVEVAILGAGSAGLYALSQVKKKTDDFVLINGGAYGTTCARVGCMPSKVLIRIAEEFHNRNHFTASGISGADQLSVSIPAVLKRVREFRDRFVGSLIQHSVAPLAEKKIDGYARFIESDLLEVGGEQIRAKKIIIATGSTPVIPDAWKGLGDALLTTDTLFEQTDLPQRIGVIGLGAIGVEIGQSLARLGLEVTGFDRGETIGGLSDSKTSEAALACLRKDFAIHMDADVSLERCDEGIRISTASETIIVDAVVASLGRRPNLGSLNLKAAGLALDSFGIPTFNPLTMQTSHPSIFIAGDVNAYRPILHEAADEGRIAGYNALHDMRSFKRKTPFGIVFSDPQIAIVGERYTDLENRDGVVVGEQDFSRQSRAIVMEKGGGLLRIYARKSDGKLLGAEMAIPSGEHIGHHLAWAIEQEMSVFDLITMPFYHPVVEEGLQSALLHLIHQIGHPHDWPVELRLES